MIVRDYNSYNKLGIHEFIPYKLMGEKGNLFLIVECQLINVERIVETESHHLATTISGGKYRQKSSMDT